MARKLALPVPPPPPFRVLKVVLGFHVGEHDAEGRLLSEGRAPQEVALYYPYSVTPEGIASAVKDVEAALNGSAAGS
jgi:hypothetical protein